MICICKLWFGNGSLQWSEREKILFSFWSVFLDLFIENKPWNCEECCSIIQKLLGSNQLDEYWLGLWSSTYYNIVNYFGYHSKQPVTCTKVLFFSHLFKIKNRPALIRRCLLLENESFKFAIFTSKRGRGINFEFSMFSSRLAWHAPNLAINCIENTCEKCFRS